jgi:hypothetical protein
MVNNKVHENLQEFPTTSNKIETIEYFYLNNKVTHRIDCSSKNKSGKTNQIAETSLRVKIASIIY